MGEYHSAESSTDFETVAEIVGKCAGLPLAIATIANALKNIRVCMLGKMPWIT